MAIETTQSGILVPDEGTRSWHTPLNTNWRLIDWFIRHFLDDDGKVVIPNSESGGGGGTSFGGDIPKGGIIMWSGKLIEIPTGWALCDGTNGTPNLLDKFVAGVATATANPGETGGANTIQLTTSQLPSHSHTATEAAHTHTMNHNHTLSGAYTDSAGNHTHSSASNGYNIPSGSDRMKGFMGTGTGSSSSSAYMYVVCDGAVVAVDTTGSAGAHSHSISGSVSSYSGNTGSAQPTITVGNTGSGTAVDNRPAFYAVAFIMKL